MNPARGPRRYSRSRRRCPESDRERTRRRPDLCAQMYSYRVGGTQLAELAAFGDLTPKRLGKPKSAQERQLAVLDPDWQPSHAHFRPITFHVESPHATDSHADNRNANQYVGRVSGPSSLSSAFSSAEYSTCRTSN